MWNQQTILTALLLTVATMVGATNYYVAPTGSDSNSGTDKSRPFATLGKALTKVKAGETVFILQGTYQVSESEISKEENSGLYKIVYNLSQKGTAQKPISIIGVSDDNGQRPVFDFSNVKPEGCRVTAFLVSGQYLQLKNFEVVGIQVTITDHTQSENFRITNGSYCTFENLACHDGMGIGFYLTKNSHHNLFVNCDAYNNYDPVSENGAGGNCDGFGCHVSAGNLQNIFVGCRAWNNSDDGFDLINCYSPVTLCYSIAYKNGYDAAGSSRGDGNGFKAGGFGMSEKEVILDNAQAPQHEVCHCIASYNKANGFYANHHLGGLWFHDNSAYKNSRYNYAMVNRRGAAATDNVDVDGYGHVLERNLSFGTNHVSSLNGGDGQNRVEGNSFIWQENHWVNDALETSLFESTKVENLIVLPRNNDGCLPYKTLQFMKQKTPLGYGADFGGYEQVVAELRQMSGVEGGTTAIREHSICSLVNTSATYDIQGRKLNSRITKKGLYVRNGRKILSR